MKSNNVSIILYFRNQRELAEQTLTAIYEHLTGPFEVFVVDDASNDGTADALRSVIEYYAHDETFFFEHSATKGRALSIQETLSQCTAPIVWMPVGFTTLNDEALRVALQQLRSSDARFAVSGSFTWPENGERIREIMLADYRLDTSRLPDDNQVLIKLRGMPADRCFVNPYLTGWFALEWLLRERWYPQESGSAASQDVCIEVSPFVHPIDDRRQDVARRAVGELQALMQRYGMVAMGSLTGEGSTSSRADGDRSTPSRSSGTAHSGSGDDARLRTEPFSQGASSADDGPAVESTSGAPDAGSTVTDISKYTAAFIEYTDDEDVSDDTPAKDKHEDVLANPDQPIQPVTGKVVPLNESNSARTAGASSVPGAAERPAARTHKLTPFGKRTGYSIDVGTSEVAASLKPRLEQFFEEGEFPLALKEISQAMEAHPGDTDLVRIKIVILERMRRYVEAAELKHKLKNGLTEFKVRKEKLLIVDPADDTSSRAAVVDAQEERFPSRPVGQDKPAAPASSFDAPSPDVPSLGSPSFGSPSLGSPSLDDNDDEGVVSAPVPVRSAHSGDSSPIDSPSKDESRHDRPEPGTTPAESQSNPLATDDAEAAGQDSDSSKPEAEAIGQDSDSTKPEADAAGQDSDSSKPEAVAAGQDSDSTKPEAAPTFPSKPVAAADPNATRISIIIPTTGDGKRLLESALVSLSRHAMMPDRELIVIDNASLDETYRYLNQLRKDRFMNIRIITNPENKGFAASVNQGMDIARGSYVFVMHNDVHLTCDAPGKLADLMDIFDDIDVMGPVSGVSLNPDQRMHQPESDPEALRYADYADSFAMLIRRTTAARFDERFETAYFEDVDFCQQIRNRGRRIAVARGIGVDHRGGATAAVLGVEPNGPQYWKNLAQFNEKWGTEPKMPFFGDETSPVFQLITISETINPYYPEKELVQLAQRLLTSETRHELVQTRHARADLYALIRLMMVLDVRDVLRQLEQQLAELDLDDQLRYELIDFYYRKHIYSRGEKYLSELPASRMHFEFRLLQLRILMGDKKLEEAAVLLNRLMDERPAHPELFKITADLHKFSGNRDEAAKFYLLAHQANPFVYSPRRDLLTG